MLTMFAASIVGGAGSGASRRRLYRQSKRLLGRLVARRWKGPRNALEPAVRRFVQARPRGYLSRLVRDRAFALAAAASLLTAGAAGACPPVNLSDVAALFIGLPFMASTALGPAAIFVDDDNCPGLGDGSIGNPYCSIQTAIHAAVAADEIVVAPGTYFETINFLGKAITLRSLGGAEVTIIDGTGFFHVVQCVNGEGRNTVLDGFTITGGNGRGMLNVNSSPTVTNCIFRNNHSTTAGGGVTAVKGNPTFRNRLFLDNTGNNRGPPGLVPHAASNANRSGTSTLPLPSRSNGQASALAPFGLHTVASYAQIPGAVLSHQKISDTQGNFTGILDSGDGFGSSVASLGDLDGDGVGDLAVGARNDDDGGANHGAVWVLFLNANGTVKSHQKISDTQGNFTGILDIQDSFGDSVASLGDLDGDGVGDLAVGASGDDDGGTDHGAVWVLFLNANGTVKSHQKISDTQGNFTGFLGIDVFFGSSTASLGDLDGDGVGDLAVGAWHDNDGGGSSRGAVWVLFLNSDGTVKSHQKISDTQGNFTGILHNGDSFGISMASLGDLDGDGVGDLAVGARNDDDGGGGVFADRGAVWVLFLNANGTVKSHQKISDTQGNFTGILDIQDKFGESVASLGDLDGDTVGDLGVGAFWDDDGGANHGAVWVLFLNANGTVKSHQKISDTQGNFTGTLDNSDLFGISTASLGDLDGDGVGDLAVGAFGDDDGGASHGAVWVLFLEGAAACPWDLDGGGVGHSDLKALIDAWGTKPGGPPDFNGDGSVNVPDLLALLANWGPCT